MNNLSDIQNIKITGVKAKPVSIPLLKPFSNHQRTVDTSEGILCWVHTNVGISGQGLVYGLGKIDQKKALEYVDQIASIIIHQPIMSPKRMWNMMFNCKLPSSFELNNAISVVDIAICDIYLKEKNIPLHQIFGGWRSCIPVYDTGGWLSLSEEELIDLCQKNSTRGIQAFKIRLGHKNDQERIANLRKTMGDKFTLMADANQRFSVEEALKVIRNLKKFNLTWIEEPVGESLNELKQVKEQSDIPIAIGENIRSEKVFKEICEKKLASYIQPDVRNCMGLTKFIEICQLTHQYAMPLCSHLMPELSSSLIAGTPNGFFVEYLEIISPDFFTHDFSIKNGQISVPNVAGTGVELTNKAIEKYSI